MKKRILSLCLLVLMTVQTFSFSQEKSEPFFKNGEGVNFIGNSITHGTSHLGQFHNYIFLYYATRFPNEKVAFYNSGKWGDNANSFLKRMDDDILTTNSDWSVVMAGMNDVNRALYRPGSEDDPEIETKRARALSDYRGYMKQVIEKLQAAGTTVILQKPSIYDQTGTFPTENWYGVNDALQECTVIIDELALEYGLKTIDYWTILNNLNLQIQETDPTATLISTDRIHPHSPGNFIMAYQFLKETNAPKYVANIQIENNTVTGCDNCQVDDLTIGEGQISFNYMAESLPFPVEDNVDLALSLVAFQNELNAEILKVSSLEEGNYILTIDGDFIGNYSSNELANGTNLATNKNTPQYKQAQKVQTKIEENKKLQVRLRDMKFVEYNVLPADIKDDYVLAVTYIDSLKNANSDRYNHNKQRCDAYLIDKPNEAGIIAQMEALHDEIYTINQPEAHAFLLEKSNSLITHMWDFNEAVINNKVEGWQITDYDNPTTVDGILHLSGSKNYPNIMNRLPAGTIDPEQSNKVVIRVKNETSETKARFYWWTTEVEATFVEFEISANDTEFKEYAIDLSGHEDWAGEITIIRFNMPFPVREPSFGKAILIDYVRLETVSQSNPDPEPNPGDGEALFVWNFDEPVAGGKVEGWTIVNYESPSTADGILNLIGTQTYNNITYVVPGGETIDPASAENVVIRVKNETNDTNARFYWWGSHAEAAFISFPITANDAEFKEYVIDLTVDERWKGSISRIRFDVPIPLTSSSVGKAVRIDYVKLTSQTTAWAEMPDRLPAPFGVNLSGAEFGSDHVPGVFNTHYTYPTPEELDYFKAKGFTLFRLPFKWERIQHELNGELNADELIRMKNFVNAARARGLWVLLDMHNYGRRKIDGTTYIIGDPMLPISTVADAWQKLAIEFKDYDNIWGYGLMNEPYSMLPSVSWFSIAQAMIDAIREVDTETTIVVGGESFSSAERWPTVSDNLKNLVDPSNDLIFEAHVYFDKDASGTYKGSYEVEQAHPNAGIDRVAPFINWLKENNFRGFIGEYGVPDNDPRWLVVLDNFLNHLKENNINGTYWAAGPWWGDYVLAVEPKDGVDRPQMATLEKYLYADSEAEPNPDNEEPLGVDEDVIGQSNNKELQLTLYLDEAGYVVADAFALKAIQGTLVISNLMGHKLREKPVSLLKGNNHLGRMVEVGLPSGIYLATIYNQDGKVSKRFLVQY